MRRMRVTRSMVYAEFVMFCQAAGKVNHDKVAEADRPLVGAWKLQYDPHPDHTGYIIQEILEDQGISFPLGHERRPARAMANTMCFTRLTLKSIRIDSLVQRQYEKIQEAIKALRPDLEDVGEWMFRRK